MKEKILFNNTKIDTLIKHVAEQIGNEMRNSQKDPLIFIGIRTNGVPFAKRVGEILTNNLNHKISYGILDIGLYRDDITDNTQLPLIRSTEITDDLTDKNVFLFDDVLYTGRTIRAALSALTDFGRPKFIKLAVLLDRGGRELPIEANYKGTDITVTDQQKVKVDLQSGSVIITEKKGVK